MDIEATLNLLFQRGNQDQIFSHILRRLSPSYIVSNDNVSQAFTGLLSRGSDSEVLQILRNHLPPGLTLCPNHDPNTRVIISRSNAADAPDEHVRIPSILQNIVWRVPEKETEEDIEEATEEATEEGIEDDTDKERDIDLELRAKSYWQDEQNTTNEKCQIESNPIERLRHFDTKQSEIDKSVNNLYCRNILVQLLMENEREIITQQLDKNEKWSDKKVRTEANAYIAEMIGKNPQSVKNSSTDCRKILGIMKDLGPGSAKYLAACKRE